MSFATFVADFVDVKGKRTTEAEHEQDADEKEDNAMVHNFHSKLSTDLTQLAMIH